MYLKEIEGFPDYYISDCGRVWSQRCTKGKLLNEEILKDDYRRVCLRNLDGKRFKLLVHRLVAEAYLDNPSGYPEVNHKDEVKANNSSCNLEWCSSQYNAEYSKAKYYTFRNPQGEIVQIYNLAKFSRENDLNDSLMHAVLNNRRTSHKGWTKHGA